MGATRHRVAGRLLLVTNLVVANLAAAVYVVLFVQPGALGGVDPAPIAAMFGSARLAIVPLHTALAWLLMLGGVVLLVANFAWLVRRREQPMPSNWVLSATPSGPVRISREALESGLQKAGEALPEITRLRTAVVTAPKRVQVTAFFQCAEGAGNLAASQRLRQVLTERFGAMVQLADGARVEFEFEFQGFAGKLGKKGVDLTPPPEAPEPPFTGPRYPIDDDGGGTS
ncbi:MAG: hypothetical protein JNL08_14320 [Planctomycetes bacterium]|nr:hypothetical protein [Planctomycetota bacterium]